MTARKKKVVTTTTVTTEIIEDGKPLPKTYVAFVLDRSGSMSSCWNEAIGAFNNTVETIKQQAKDQETSVTFYTFSNNSQQVFFNRNPNELNPLNPHDIRCDGMTALFDGVGDAVEALKKVKDANESHVSFLVITITDGGENNSTRYGTKERGLHPTGWGQAPKKDLVELLRETQTTDRWSFVFQVPPGSKRGFVMMGVPDDNIREWNNDRRGAIEADRATQVGLTSFFQGKKRGVNKVTQFFVETDMSNVDIDDIKKKLTDESDRYKQYDVSQEAVVKDFVESKTKREYVIGSAYYLLMKTEKVQPQKGVLIMEKKKKAVWAGRQARKLIGLPDGVEAKVCPGNHASYDIYVQSTSVNRKLPRGTKVLVDTQLTKGLSPTWDHTAVVNK